MYMHTGFVLILACSVELMSTSVLVHISFLPVAAHSPRVWMRSKGCYDSLELCGDEWAIAERRCLVEGVGPRGTTGPSAIRSGGSWPPRSGYSAVSRPGRN